MVVTTNQSIKPNQVPDSDLVSYNKSVMNMMYVAVAFNLNKDQWKREIVIGDGKNYNYSGAKYFNAPLNKNFTYYLFLRLYHSNHTKSVSFCYNVS